ncbi:MAG: pentapeptide repeat-containing protein [Coleofasciculus sp. B1-GNL1-01]|uniref:pentapeptide repeat-containing protein n=1 Tax=Coleofasciculus sp. B1-GNL1-01 TaxID=3068484 RepID=UPI0032F96065
MEGRIIPDNQQIDSSADGESKQQRIQQAQEVIFQFLLERVENDPPETVLQDFKQLFFSSECTQNPDVARSMYELLEQKNEQEFRNTLKRSCYILINNWLASRRSDSIEELIQTLAKVDSVKSTVSQILNRLRTWIANFIESQDYQELKVFTSSRTERRGWSHRYAYYLLLPQYLDSQNPVEQRELAKKTAKRLKEKFKFELAMYTVHCNSPTFKKEPPPNPTRLGNGIIRLLKQLISRKFLHSYSHTADLFVQQSKTLTYRDFKQKLIDYLLSSTSPHQSIDFFKKTLTEKLEILYESYNEETTTMELLLRTCRRTLEFLTTENGQEPSPLFITLTSQGSPLTIVILLLKIILLCNYVRTHLDNCIANLIRYYEKYPETECRLFIHFLDIFNVVFAIYTENVQFDVVKIKKGESEVSELEAYRIFCQLKGADLRGSDLKGADIRNSDLSAADLREANLSSADLSEANLSLAKLGGANLSSAILMGADLTVTDLNSANLNGANLNNANLSRSNLQNINLRRASLMGAKLRHTNLQQADLSHGNLNQAILTGANLKNANLRQTSLREGDLSEVDLSEANLSQANLTGADLQHSQLDQATLEGAILEQANLSEASLFRADLSQANLNNAQLNQAMLRGANLKEVRLRRAILSHANLEGANLSRADLSRADLSHLNLRGADLSQTFLRHVNLTNADLRQANLTGANLFNANLSGAKVEGAIFKQNAGLSAAQGRELEQRGATVEVSKLQSRDRNVWKHPLPPDSPSSLLPNQSEN